jgi:hypothetical protein
MAHEIVQFINVGLNKYFMDMVLGIDISQFPDPLQKILHVIQVKGALAAPAAFNAAMAWVYEQELEYMPAYLIEEMDAMADGICHTLGAKCNVTEVHSLFSLPLRSFSPSWLSDGRHHPRSQHAP